MGRSETKWNQMERPKRSIPLHFRSILDIQETKDSSLLRCP